MKKKLVRTKTLALAFKRWRAACAQLGTALVLVTIRLDRWLTFAFRDTVG
jgi:hypothetical protein